ncbi:MAG: class I SAM-dependent methyltransferase [Beijerinckiaceae bacterium]|nr:class I SAM-dependent methyltransferase [Beijerinckiaceae bacterium]
MPATIHDTTPDPEAGGLAPFKQVMYDNYDQTHRNYGNHTESAWQARFQGHVQVLRAMLPPGKSAPILDLGCGDGLLLAVAQALGYTNLAGVDLSDTLIRSAAKRSRAKLYNEDGLEFLRSQPDGAFEAIIAFDIFEHLTRPYLFEISREIARVLKPGGRLILRVPNGCSPLYGRLLWSDLTHERPFTAGAIQQLLLPLGFDRIEPRDFAPFEVRGIKSAIMAAAWQIFRAVTLLRVALELGRASGEVLTINLHIIAHKRNSEPGCSEG